MTQDELYNEIKEAHPEWSDEQIWTQVSIRISGEETISQNPDMTVNDNDIVKTIIRMADNWIHENLPYIWEKVKGWFENILNNIIDWFKERGWSFLTDIFTDFFTAAY